MKYDKRDISREIMEISSACDSLSHAASKLKDSNDWIAAAALFTLTGMITDLGLREKELRAIRKAVRDVRKEKENEE